MRRPRRHLAVGWIGVALMAAGGAWFAVLAGLVPSAKTPRMYDLVDLYSLLVIVCLLWGFVALRSGLDCWSGIREAARAGEQEADGAARGAATQEAARTAREAGAARKEAGRGQWTAAILLNGVYVVADLAFLVFLVYAFCKATSGGG